MRIGTYRSLTHPTKRYAIFRHGKTKNSGGDGVTWECGCEADPPCKHLKSLWQYSKAGKLSDLIVGNLVTLTKDGKRILEFDEPTTATNHVALGTIELLDRFIMQASSEGVCIDDVAALVSERFGISKSFVEVAINKSVNRLISGCFVEHITVGNEPKKVRLRVCE